MNKKLLIGAAIATTLLISACVKKEAPKEEAETKGQEASQPAQFQNLSSVDHANASSTEIPTQVTNETLEQNNHNAHTTHPQQTETHPAPAAYVDRAEPAPAPAAKPAEKPAAPVAKVVEATKPAVQANTSAKAQSEDDAVAAAIAAAAPALKN